MKKITFLLFLLSSAVTFGQINYDFEDPGQLPQFQFGNLGFGNVLNPDPVNNASARALEVNKPDTADWAGGFGFETPGVALIDLSIGTEFTFKVWAPIAGQSVRFQIQNSINGAPTYNIDTVIANAGVWTDVTIDFASQTNGTEQYSVLVIQPNYDSGCEGGGCTTVGAGNGGIWYFDDIVQTFNFDPTADATLSDLTVGGSTVAGFASNITTYNVNLLNGTATAPTVAGVATQAGSGSSSVNVTQAGSVPGTATLDVTAPNGVDMQTYTVNFIELAPAAPVPTEPAGAVFPILTNNPSYSDFGVPFFERFGSVGSFFDLDNSGADDAISFQNGNGGQVNYFPSGVFPNGIDAAGVFHIDFYCENLDAGDNFRVVLLPNPTSVNMEFRVFVDETQAGTWQSFEIGLAGAGSGLPDEFTGADISNFGELGLIQIFPAEAGSTLGSEQVYVSNIYFSGGTLSTPDVELADSFAVAPNPTTGVWNIKAANNQNITSVIVYDLLGKQVLTTKPNTNEVVLNASDLKSGIYLAKLSTTNGTKTIKLVRQ